MRTYFIDDELDEHIIDLEKTLEHSHELIEFNFSTFVGVGREKEQRVFVRKLAGLYFVSFDNKKWERIPRQKLPKEVLNVNRHYALYRGYKPSGLTGSGAGELVTKMPGKVVKVLVRIGDKVCKGQTLVLLEAMKMENEIKSGMAGIVTAIYVSVGDTLEQGFLMMEVDVS